MSHELDFSLNHPAIAFAGETPWHRFGQKLDPAAPLEVWTREAGLDWEARASTVNYSTPADDVQPGAIREWTDQRVLYRSDTGRPLSIVSPRYRIVQPAEVMGFFADLLKIGGFTMETAGALNEGRRIWALARCGDEAPILGNDTARPYLLLATSFDGSICTMGRFTAIRVVCANTLTMTLREEARTHANTSSVVKVSHVAKFDPAAMKSSLGIGNAAWMHFLGEARRLANRQATAAAVDQVILAALPPKGNGPDELEKTRDSAGYRRILDLFNGAGMGSDMPAARGTLWGALNAVTQYVDHESGRDANRLNASLFGSGEAAKDRARAAALALA